MRGAKFGFDFVSGAAQEGFSQVVLGRNAPMTGKPTVGGALGSLFVKSMVPEVKGVMQPNHFALSPYDKVAVKKSPVLMSNQGRQHFQGQGAWNSRDIGRHQRQFEIMKTSYPNQFEAHDDGIRAEMMSERATRKFQ